MFRYTFFDDGFNHFDNDILQLSLNRLIGLFIKLCRGSR